MQNPVVMLNFLASYLKSKITFLRELNPKIQNDFLSLEFVHRTIQIFGIL